MYGQLRAALMSALVVLPSYGQDGKDTLVFSLQEVIIEGSLSSDAASRAATFSKAILLQDLHRLEGTPVDRALRRSGLVYVRDRGGRSSVTTIGLRGNTANQTSVTLDGFSLTNEQNGIVDFGLYPLDILGGIDLQRGAQSAFTGSGGIGGAVHLHSRNAIGRSAEVQVGAGSFDAWSASLGLPFEALGIPVTVRAGWISDRGAFPFNAERYGGTGSSIRGGNRSSMVYGHIQSRIAEGADAVLTSMVYLVSADRDSPGPASVAHPADATLSDDMIRAGARYLLRKGSTMWETEIAGYYHGQAYVDRSVLLPVSDAYRNRGITAAVRTMMPLAGDASLTAGLEAGKHEIRASMISFPGGSTRGAGTIALRYPTVANGPILMPSVRWDVFSDLKPIVSWKLSIHQPVLARDRLTFRLGAGSGFRMPTFNERYWRVGGNPDLKHERAVMIEGGVQSAFEAWGAQEFQVLAYWSEVRDKIVGWPAENAERVQMLGTELTWSWVPSEVLTFRSGTALAEVRSIRPYYAQTQLPYIPRLSGSGEVILRLFGYDASCALEYVSRRFTTIENIRALSSDPYTVVSLSLLRTFELEGCRLRASFFVDNLLDTSYEIVQYYPMPGRSFRGTLTLELDE